MMHLSKEFKNKKRASEDTLLDEVTTSYSIYVGLSEQSEHPKVDVYKIVNSSTGVNEGETSILARAYAYCLAFEADLEEVLSSMKDSKQLDLPWEEDAKEKTIN